MGLWAPPGSHPRSKQAPVDYRLSSEVAFSRQAYQRLSGLWGEQEGFTLCMKVKTLAFMHC